MALMQTLPTGGVVGGYAPTISGVPQGSVSASAITAPRLVQAGSYRIAGTQQKTVSHEWGQLYPRGDNNW